jgi:hypothetical protein
MIMSDVAKCKNCAARGKDGKPGAKVDRYAGMAG